MYNISLYQGNKDTYVQAGILLLMLIYFYFIRLCYTTFIRLTAHAYI